MENIATGFIIFLMAWLLPPSQVHKNGSKYYQVHYICKKVQEKTELSF